MDDEEEILNALNRIMRKTDANCIFAGSGQEGLDILTGQAVDIVVSDMKMPEMNGVDFLAQVANLYPETVRLVLTGHADFNFVMDAINSGNIFGYLQKPWQNDELLATLKQASLTRNLQLERMLLRRSLSRFERFNRNRFHGFVGDSPEMQLVYQTIEMVGPANASVFITGSSGTGKEVAAEAIHQCSKRAKRPFIALNCAAIPKDLVESEIFGHLKGAFTGAVQNREGAASKANGGTLFLDELAEMDYALQSKLLRFIQTGTFQRVGSDKAEKVDIRFICATNKDPMQAIADKELREDLFYRLNVVAVDLPDLKDRLWDPVILAEHFLGQYAKQENKALTGFSDDAEKLLFHYCWPGNVRQLQNTINSLVILSAGPVISAQEIARMLKLDQDALKHLIEQPVPYIAQAEKAEAADAQRAQVVAADSINVASSLENAVHTENNTPTTADSPLANAPQLELKPLAEMERDIIQYAISNCDGNVVTAARKLAVSPSTLYRKIQSWEDK